MFFDTEACYKVATDNEGNNNGATVVVWCVAEPKHHIPNMNAIDAAKDDPQRQKKLIEEGIGCCGF